MSRALKRMEAWLNIATALKADVATVSSGSAKSSIDTASLRAVVAMAKEAEALRAALRLVGHLTEARARALAPPRTKPPGALDKRLAAAAVRGEEALSRAMGKPANHSAKLESSRPAKKSPAEAKALFEEAGRQMRAKSTKRDPLNVTLPGIDVRAKLAKAKCDTRVRR